jgi:3-methyladenine DNA glycosylase AlkD
MARPNPDEAVKQIVAWLEARHDPAFAEGQRRFFQHEVATMGVRSPELHRLAREWRREIKPWPVAARNRLMDLLWRDGRLETGALVCFLYRGFAAQCGACEFKLFERWIDRYVRNWAHCDGVASWLLAASIANEPALRERLLPWTASPNRWKRRAAAVALLQEAKAGRHFDTIAEVAARLLPDQDDMVEKGVGWLLKETYPKQPEAAMAFLIEHRARASRLTLRIAAEKIPAEQRRTLLARD